MFFLEMILMGIWATLVMDILAIILSKSHIIRPRIGPEIVGRWTLYMLKGKFAHNDINKTPVLKNEIIASWISHYLIGIALTGIYLFLGLNYPLLLDSYWAALIFGILTVLLPWLWLFPSIGIGIMASKMPEKSPYLFTSFINHTDFGLGMALWMIVFHPYFV